MGGQMPAPPDPEKIKELQELAKLPTWEAVSAILRSDQRRGYKIDVETDQTAMQNEMEEKNSRIEFMSTIQQLMEKAIPLAVQMPAMRPLVKESVMFVVKAFKAGRPMEEAFDDAFEQLAKMPAPQGQGDPVAEAKAQQIQTETKISIQQAQADAQAGQIEAQAKQQSAQADMQAKQLDIAARQQDMQVASADARANMQASQAERAMKAQASQFDLARKYQEAAMDAEMAQSNKDLADILARVQAADAVEGFKAKRRDEGLSQAAQRQKMQHAERKANQPQATGA